MNVKRLGPEPPVGEALLALPKVCPHTACVDARDLKGHIGDNVHYDAASANAIGARMAAKYLEMQRELTKAP